MWYLCMNFNLIRKKSPSFRWEQFTQLEPTNFSAKAEDVIRIIEELKSHYIKEEKETININKFI